MCWPGEITGVPHHNRKQRNTTVPERELPHGRGNYEYSLEGLVLKLKLQYFGHLMGRTDSLEKTLMLGKIEGMKSLSHV